MKSNGIVGLEMSRLQIRMKNKSFFADWINKHWNKLAGLASFREYEIVKEKYLEEIGGYHNLTNLCAEDNLITIESNMLLFIAERWLYHNAAKHNKEKMLFFKETNIARMALIYCYLFNKNDRLFYNYHLEKGIQVSEKSSNIQFYPFWMNLSENKDLALSLLDNLADDNLFVVFMGLRRLGLFEKANEIGKKIGYKTDDYNPNISTTNAPLLCYYSPYESLDLIKQAGFDTFDYSMETENEFFTSENYILKAKRLRKYADSVDMVCNQTHSIFPVWRKDMEKEVNIRRIEYTKRILQISKILGAKNCVIHPINDYDELQNYTFYQEFLPLAKTLGINIATENMWNWENDKASLAACSNHNNYKKLLDLVNDKRFVACVDIGHAEMEGLNTSAVQMLETLGKYVKCLHVHDNDLHNDRHGLPYMENIDFDLIINSLVRINYRGDITFECDYFIHRMPKELHLSCLKFMYSIGKYMKYELLTRRPAKCLNK